MKNKKPALNSNQTISHKNNSNEDWHKVGFIGISNWVLDPAKMNRGIFVNRCSPSINELKDIVVGICKNDENVLKVLESTNLINSLSSAYLKLCDTARTKTREFFGLRDFYSLIKMIYWHIKENDVNLLDWSFLDKAIRRNFGGLIDIDPTVPFIKQFKEDNINLKLKPFKISVIDLIREALLKKTTEDENRYLLLLSQNDNALDLINNYILNEFDDHKLTENKNSNVKIIFGSSFPNDQKYHQICRKIHQIKLSMELGKTVILLNLENLYESLYDALNQFYHKFGDNEKFVDLGLGTQRVKCLVHNDFRLIVVADKKSVYNPKKYPIPLVNRLEKHLLSLDSILNEKMKWMVKNISDWCNQITISSDKNSGFHHFLSPKIKSKTVKNNVYLKPSDIFIGFTEDTISSLVFKQYKDYNINLSLTTEDYEKDDFDWTKHAEEIIQLVKNYLLQCATSDAIIRLLQITSNNNFKSSFDLNWVVEKYFIEQPHDNFINFFQNFCIKNSSRPQFVQLTTHSKLMSKKNIENVSKLIKNSKIRYESLHNFDTQQQFSQVLREFYALNLNPDNEDHELQNVLIIQCDCSHFYQDLVNCARFTIIDEYDKYLSEHETDIQKQQRNPFTVFFILQIPKIKDGCISGFQTAKWLCYHIDDLQDDFSIGNVLNYKNKSLSELFSEGILK